MPGCYIWNLVTFGFVVSEEKSFESVDGRRTTDDGRTTEASHTKSSPGAFGSGELSSREILRNWYNSTPHHVGKDNTKLITTIGIIYLSASQFHAQLSWAWKSCITSESLLCQWITNGQFFWCVGSVVRFALSANYFPMVYAFCYL